MMSQHLHPRSSNDTHQYKNSCTNIHEALYLILIEGILCRIGVNVKATLATPRFIVSVGCQAIVYLDRRGIGASLAPQFKL